MHTLFLGMCRNDFPSPKFFGGGVEVNLRVREAKTKKCAILWTPNLTMMPARLEQTHEFMVLQIHEKVILISVTQYIHLSRGAGKGAELFGACLVLPGCLVLAKGLWFQSSEAVFGSWLARGLTGHSGGRSIEVLLFAMHTTACSYGPGFRCTLCALAFKSAHAFAWVAMLKCGDSLPMANVEQLTIGVTPCSVLRLCIGGLLRRT